MHLRDMGCLWVMNIINQYNGNINTFLYLKQKNLEVLRYRGKEPELTA
jgi:hypothetical protein